jgi:hypothetical protein
MQITTELLEKQRAALVTERDGYLEEAENLRAQATGVEGALRIIDYLLTLARKPEGNHE